MKRHIIIVLVLCCILYRFDRLLFFISRTYCIFHVLCYMHAIFSHQFVIFVAFTPASTAFFLPPRIHHIFMISVISVMCRFLFITKSTEAVLAVFLLYFTLLHDAVCVCVSIANERAYNNCELCRLVQTRTRFEFIRKIANAFE